MPLKHIPYCFIFVIAVLLLRVAQSSAVALEYPVKLFILHSYERKNVCGQPQHDGLLAALDEAGYTPDQNIDLNVYYMDTKRKHNTLALIHKQADIALNRIEAFQPAILVTLDDNAFQSVALRLVDTDIDILFSGLNGQPEFYNQQVTFMKSRINPDHNITGVYERLHIANAMRVHARMFPEVQKALVLTDPSPTGKAIFRQIELELTNEAVPISWELKMIQTWEDFHREIAAVNQNPLIGVTYPAVLLLKNRKGKTYTAPQIFQWTIANSRKPEITLNHGMVRLGLFGGAAVDLRAMGHQVGRMVVKVIGGNRAGDLAIEEAEKYALAFNLKRAQDLNIVIPDEMLLEADEIVQP